MRGARPVIKPTMLQTRPNCKGFNLVEIMVAIAIGLLLMLALTTLFVNITSTNKEMANTNSQIENARFSMQVLEADVQHAGFWGDYLPEFEDLTMTSAPADAPFDVPSVCLDYSTTNWDQAYKINLLGIPVQTYDAVPTGCEAIVVNKKANTDVLVLRHAETCLPGVGNCEADIAGRLYFQSSLCDSDPHPYVLDTTNFVLRKKDCTALADKRRFISNIYYIRDYAQTAGDGIPTLVRSQFDVSGGVPAHQTPQALVEGVEGFRVELGVDSLSETGGVIDYTSEVEWQDPDNWSTAMNRGDGVPDNDYVHCETLTPCDASTLSNVVAVKLYVLARSSASTPGYTDTKTYTLGGQVLGPFNDNFKRHVFTTTIRLMNKAGRRETP
jgi:type IV pilus assembly protein PilW